VVDFVEAVLVATGGMSGADLVYDLTGGERSSTARCAAQATHWGAVTLAVGFGRRLRIGMTGRPLRIGPHRGNIDIVEVMVACGRNSVEPGCDSSYSIVRAVWSYEIQCYLLRLAAGGAIRFFPPAVGRRVSMGEADGELDEHEGGVRSVGRTVVQVG